MERGDNHLEITGSLVFRMCRIIPSGQFLTLLPERTYFLDFLAREFREELPLELSPDIIVREFELAFIPFKKIR
jgi:hypothetical protein